MAQPSCRQCALLGGSEARAAARERRVAVGPMSNNCRLCTADKAEAVFIEGAVT